jgi:hypothetical protein
VGDGRQLARVVPAQVEHGILVDQVGQPVGARLLVSLQAGPVALGLDQLVEPPHDRPHRVRVEQAGQGQVALLVELGPVGVGQQLRAGPERAENPQHLLFRHHSIVNCQRYLRKWASRSGWADAARVARSCRRWLVPEGRPVLIDGALLIL